MTMGDCGKSVQFILFIYLLVYLIVTVPINKQS